MTQKIVVTGGGGFVGKALCLALKQRGYSVLSLSRGDYPELRRQGIETLRVDLGREEGRVKSACQGAIAIFHVAARVDMWGEYEDFFRDNVLATRHLLSAAAEAGISRFIYTSSPSVVADGTDLLGINESYPIPKHFEAYYPMTKAQSEREVLAANSATFKTIALRPHLIWGPGDTNLIPTILERAKAGTLMIIGSGENKVDLSYIDDCVAAHLCAFEALERNPASGGRSYFISQGEPVALWTWINRVLTLNGCKPITRKVPKKLALALAWLFESIARLRRKGEPRFTRFLVSEMATSHYFDISAARKELGYEPEFSIDEGMKVTFPA